MISSNREFLEVSTKLNVNISVFQEQFIATTKAVGVFSTTANPDEKKLQEQQEQKQKRMLGENK